jgi:hypothetical protein
MARIRQMLTGLVWIATLGASAQSNCPTLTQQTLTYPNGSTQLAVGLAQGASVTVNVVGSSLGAASTYITDAADYNTDFFASNQSVAVNDVATDPGTAGTTSHPVITVVEATQADLVAAGCSQTEAACSTILAADSSGHTMQAITRVLSSAISSPAFEELMAHEDGHNMLGLNDCAGCSNTEMNNVATTSSPSGPTACDTEQVYDDSGGSFGCADPCDGICAY